ncbi:hypothetical protein [Paraglaciecola polaris]|uniref:Phosphoenolpyruvate protein kinase n=1 Tax=Paraglaciecola polaris LMG 21857 TaxID=1129793 RepID=K6YQ64_9ALTE|nr:hypothetical protein [Paraglaciecola polaris]GAC34864.1 hypothetical protein GPLA_3985 [Paraglaciecola polaris LMG 21857]
MLNRNIGLLNQLVNPALVRRSLVTALVVGLILNVINQYDGLIGRAPILWGNLILTFIVPYFVSTISGILTLRQITKQHAARQNAA